MPPLFPCHRCGLEAGIGLCALCSVRQRIRAVAVTAAMLAPSACLAASYALLTS